MDIDCDVIDVDLWSPIRIGTYPSSARVLDKMVDEMNIARRNRGLCKGNVCTGLYYHDEKTKMIYFFCAGRNARQ